MFDLVVIGGGPGGYTAAIRGAQKGARVAVVEADRLGGTCLNRGCIPTKTLLQTADTLDGVRRASQFGVHVEGVTLDYEAAVARKDAVVDGMVRGLEHLVKAQRITVFPGTGTMVNQGVVRVQGPGGEEDLSAPRVIIATGSKPATPPIPGIDAAGILNSTEALALRTVPTSMAVIGGGVIGVEMATLFAALGASVTVIEALPEILPGVDSELRRRLMVFLKRSGITIKAAARVTGFGIDKDRVQIRFADAVGRDVVLAVEKALLATGRVPNTEGLNLEGLGVARKGPGIAVDAYLACKVPGIWAVGDVTGGTMLAHVASYQGLVAADNALGERRAADYSSVPYAIFCRPELSGVGLTEDKAKEQGISYRIGRFSFAANGKAQAQGDNNGLVKVLAAEDGRILGVHILGPHASELIHEGALAIKMGAGVRDLSTMIHAHPTLSEAFAEAVHDVWGEAVNALPRKSTAATQGAEHKEGFA